MADTGDFWRLRRARVRARRRWGRISPYLTERKFAVFVEGLIVVGVPFTYTLFPELANDRPLVPRVLLAGLWLLCATLVAVAAYRQSQLFAVIAGDAVAASLDDRQAAGADLLSMLLDNVDQALSGLEFRIFALDEDTGLLRTSWYPDGVEPLDHGWAPGTGVVGTAYQNEEWTVALGARCHDATHRLNPQEQERYKNLNTVASMPMLNARRKVVAVLTGSSSQELGVLNTPQGRAAFAKLAVAAQRLWIDVFRIAHD